MDNLNAQQALMQSRLRFAKKGILVGLLAGALWGLQGTIMGKVGGMAPFADPNFGVWMICIASLCTGAFHDFWAGIWITIYNVSTGRGLKEYFRLLKTKLGRLIVLGAIFGGPLATGCYLIGVNLCGATYTMAISGAYPVVGAFLGVFLFKEKISKRAWVGILLAVLGSLIVGYAPPEGGFPYFYVGIAFAVIAGIFWALEGVTVTYANDMADPNISVGLYRTFFSGLFYTIIIIPIFCLIAKEGISAGWHIMGGAITAGTPLLLIAIAAIAGGVSYLSFYRAMNMTGVGRAMSLNITFSLWSIVFGFLFEAFGLIHYNVTMQAIIGVCIIVLGTIIVIANPKELLQLRK